MANVVVFHSALGLRPSITRLGDLLRGDGHRVWTPDLYRGSVFDDVDAGIDERDRIGIPELVHRACASLSDVPDEVVYVGFSMGAGPAELLGATRPSARGVILVQGALPLQALGVGAWPEDVPVQLHSSPADPWQDTESLIAFMDAVPTPLLEHHEYPGCSHLFTDEDLPAHDQDATAQFLGRVRRWLAER